MFYKYFLPFYGLSFDFSAGVLLVIELLVDSLFPSIFWSCYLTVLYPPWFLMRNYQVDSAVDRYGSLSSLEFVELLLVVIFKNNFGLISLLFSSGTSIKYILVIFMICYRSMSFYTFSSIQSSFYSSYWIIFTGLFSSLLIFSSASSNLLSVAG